jgi:hypothetical protein
MATGRTEDHIYRWLSLAAPTVHLLLCIAVSTEFITAEGSWAGFLVFLVDLPFSILLLFVVAVVGHHFLVFGVLGTLWWWYLSRFAIYLFRLATARLRRP